MARTQIDPEMGSPEARRRARVRAWGLVTRHPWLASLSAVVGVGLVVFVLVWFQPQKLFLDQTVNEALPRGSPAVVPSGPLSTSAPSVGLQRPVGPVTLASGAFRSLEHGTTGKALVIRLADGSRFLRFENLNTSNGPDLHVYLSEVPAGPDWHAYGERFVDLGKLKGNIGSQNYSIPGGVDLASYRSAVIWCQRFAVGFGVAPLA